MALLFETNGDWPDSDDDYRKLFDEDIQNDTCYFCDRVTNCICDSVYDLSQEQELLEPADDE